MFLRTGTLSVTNLSFSLPGYPIFATKSAGLAFARRVNAATLPATLPATLLATLLADGCGSRPTPDRWGFSP